MFNQKMWIKSWIYRDPWISWFLVLWVIHDPCIHEIQGSWIPLCTKISRWFKNIKSPLFDQIWHSFQLFWEKLKIHICISLTIERFSKMKKKVLTAIFNKWKDGNLELKKNFVHDFFTSKSWSMLWEINKISVWK